MAGVSGITIGTATSIQPEGYYVEVATTSTTGTGSGLTLNFRVNADGTIAPENFNVVGRGDNYAVGDLFIATAHGPGSQMTVAAVSTTVEKSKHNRFYVQVQPNEGTGPATYNLSDRDVTGGGNSGGGGGDGTKYLFEADPPVVVDVDASTVGEETVTHSLDFQSLPPV